MKNREKTIKGLIAFFKKCVESFKCIILEAIET